jgi:hypothetical protein
MKLNTSEDINGFTAHKSYTPQEILAAGGTTAFALRHGKTNESLIRALESVGITEPFTEKEWKDFLLEIEKDK